MNTVARMPKPAAIQTRTVIPNQIFVGLPWRRVKPKYERCLLRLHRSLPVYFHVVGNRDPQEAEDLLQRITKAIDSSSYAVFDATGGNANVALEFGYAEAKALSRALYLSDHKRSNPSGHTAIISDLAGKKQNRYKNENTLYDLLHKLAKEHPFTVRFDRAMRKLTKGKTGDQAKRIKSASLKVVRVLDGHAARRREEVVDALEVGNFSRGEAARTLRGLQRQEIIRATTGKAAAISLR